MNRVIKAKIIDRAEELYSEGRHNDILELMMTCNDIHRDPDLAIITARALLDISEEDSGEDLSESAEMLLLTVPDGASLPAWHYQLARSYFLRGRTVETLRTIKNAFNVEDETGNEFADKRDAEELLAICEQEYENLDNEYTDEQLETVLRHIERSFGRITMMIPGSDPIGVTPDIAVIDPDETRSYRTLITVGAGAYKMNIPNDLKGMIDERCELVMYLPPEWNPERCLWALSFMKTIADLPIERGSWSSYGHMFSGGKPLTADTKLCAAVLIEVQDAAAGAGKCSLSDGTNVCFYQLFPLYREEMEYKLRNGLGALIDKMPHISAVVDLQRENVCENESCTRPTLLADEIDYASSLDIGEYCAASRKILEEGHRVAYMRRFLFDEQAPGLHSDSGWLFMSGLETSEFFTNPYNIELCRLNTVCNIDSEVLPFLTMPYNTVIVRNSDGILRPEPADTDFFDIPPS